MRQRRRLSSLFLIFALIGALLVGCGTPGEEHDGSDEGPPGAAGATGGGAGQCGRVHGRSDRREAGIGGDGPRAVRAGEQPRAPEGARCA